VPLRKRWLAGMIADARFAAAIGDLEDIELDRYPVLRFMRRAWELRANVTPYDATYVALAEVLGCELWTADHRLAQAPGPACAIRVLSRFERGWHPGLVRRSARHRRPGGDAELPVRPSASILR
jgi:hypothetical protein